MNSIYELDQIGLWQNGMLYMAAEDIEFIGSVKEVMGDYSPSLPEVGEMLLVTGNKLTGKYGGLRTSLVEEIISNG
jgi:hypothetical protein